MGSRQIMEPASDWNVASSCWVFWLDVNNVAEKVPGLLGREEKWEPKQCSAMRPIKLSFGQNNICKMSRASNVSYISIHRNMVELSHLSM